MTPNSETNQFELEPFELIALGEPVFEQQVPFADAPRLLDRAQQRLVANDQRDISEFPHHNRMSLIVEQARTRSCLLGIIRDVVVYLPDVSTGAEEFLRDYKNPTQ